MQPFSFAIISILAEMSVAISIDYEAYPYPRIILVSSTDKILEQIDEDLGKFASQKLKQSGVEFIMNHHVKGASPTRAKLDDGSEIMCYTLVWSTGVTPSKLIANLPCEHDKSHRIVVNNYLELPGYKGVYVLGDCAAITDPHTGNPYPTTAQHAIREAKVAAKNIILDIRSKKGKKKAKFDYKTRGMMAEIGKRTGVATILGIKIHGFAASWLWRTYYLGNLPTIKKKLKVMGDWTSNLFFKPDVAMIKIKLQEEDKTEKLQNKENEIPNEENMNNDSKQIS